MGRRGAAVARDQESRLPAEGYWHQSRRPIHILVFLLPLILAYEASLALLLRADDVTNLAHRTLVLVFETLGVGVAGGLYLGGVVIVVVLLIWHILVRDGWRIRWAVVGQMAAESLLLTLPLLALGLIIQRSHLDPAGALGLWAGAPAAPGGGNSGAVAWADLSLGSRLAISIGAGLYEELLFRMLLIAMVHTLLVDLAKLDEMIGVTVAVLLSAVAFTAYHPLHGEGGAISWSRVTFFFLAGVYFGLVFLVRGFGIVVGAHALYDVITVVMLEA